MLNKGQKARKKKPLAGVAELDSWLSHAEPHDDSDVLDVESTEVETPPEGTFNHNTSAFLSAKDRLQKITSDFRQFCQCSEADQQLELLGQMQEQIKAVRGAFLGAELSLWARFTTAISTFLFATAQKPGFLTFSSPRTMVNALDLLTRAVVSGSHWRGIDPGPITALVMDPDESARQSLQIPMLSQGMKIAECETVQQALDCLRENAIDVIFSDAALAGGNGSSFAKELHKLPNHYSTPLILVTPERDFGEHSADINGACDFIAKPIAPTEIVLKALAFGLKSRVETEQAHAHARRPAAIADRKPVVPKPHDESSEPAQPPPEISSEPFPRSHAHPLHPVEPETVSRSIRPRSAVERSAELERAQKALNHDLAEALRRESQLKQRTSELEAKLEALEDVLAKVREELAQESECRLAAEQRATQSDEHRGALEKELAARALEPRPAQKRAAELERMQHTLRNDLNGALQREDQLKTQCASFKQELTILNQTLDEARRGMDQEKNRREAAERSVNQLTNRLQEQTRKESALHEQMEQMARDRVDEACRLQAALRKEVAARHQADTSRQQADKTVADLSAHRSKLEKKLAETTSTVAELSAQRSKLEKALAESTAQAEKAQDRVAGLERIQKSAQLELEEILERRRQIEKQNSALADHIDSLSRTLKSKGN